MSFGSFDSRSSSQTAAEINMVPLIDVMLVLLVIFLITAPLLTHSIKVQLPQATAQPVEKDAKSLDLAVTLDGALFLNNDPVAMEDLTQTLAIYAQEKPQPEIRIRADQETRYEILAQVMSKAKAAGMVRLGFVTRPGAEQGAATPAPADATDKPAGNTAAP
ncbi:ExbD/TolR family protein [Paenalcaligenes sp. Me131]|uniref:ExbD/TolR family protein n=1 Tax=Paenalcaligenes sp. Me131 TaxID=3392636 RepID=UPI003D2B29A1